jgi:uncharacterized protein Usg
MDWVPAYAGTTRWERIGDMASDFEKMLGSYRLTTAEILYHLPDYPRLVQSFTWQDYDLSPRFPTLFKFLKFWDDQLDGRIHSVMLAHRQLILPAEWRGTHVCLTVQ